MFRIEHNIETNQVLTIPLTAEEIAELEPLQQNALEKTLAAQAEAEAIAEAKAALLEQLGITEEQAKLLLS